MKIMELTKTIIGALILVSFVVGGVLYQGHETGEEITCGTNKPIGFEIKAEHEGYSEAYCPYATGQINYVNCTGFRKTPSYLRYACTEFVFEETPVIEQPIETIVGINGTIISEIQEPIEPVPVESSKSGSSTCKPNKNGGCEEI